MESNITPDTQYQQVTVDVPEDRVAEFHAFFGRFLAFLRMWAAFLAGMNRMNWRAFLMYNAAGGIVWSIYIGILGYVAGRVFHDHFDQVQHLASVIGWFGLASFILIIAVAFLLLRWRRHRRSAETTDTTDKTETSKEHLLV